MVQVPTHVRWRLHQLVKGAVRIKSESAYKRISEYGWLGRFPAVQGRWEGSIGAWPRPSRRTALTVARIATAAMIARIIRTTTIDPVIASTPLKPILGCIEFGVAFQPQRAPQLAESD